jgi:hypothetical protein
VSTDRAPMVATCPACGIRLPTRVATSGALRLPRHDVRPHGPSCPGTGKQIAP